MAITAHWYTLALDKLARDTLFATSWAADTVNVGLVTATYTPAQDTDSFWNTPQANEISGTGYSAGGVALGSKAIGAVTGSHEIPLTAASSVWSAASFTCRYAVIYRSTGVATTSPLLGWVDLGANASVASGTLTLQWDATNGVLALSAL